MQAPENQPKINKKSSGARRKKESRLRTKVTKINELITELASYFFPQIKEAKKMIIDQYGPTDTDLLENLQQIEAIKQEQEKIHKIRETLGEKNYLGTLRVALADRPSLKQNREITRREEAIIKRRLSSGPTFEYRNKLK